MAFSMISESLSLSGSMSYRAISLSLRAGVHMQSPNTFLANTVLPAPMKVIFGIIVPPHFLIARFYIYMCMYFHFTGCLTEIIWDNVATYCPYVA